MRYHEVLCGMKYTNFEELENIINSIKEPDVKGKIFEQFTKAFFILQAKLYQIKEVYLFAFI